ncbi:MULTISPECIES: Na+/H+ antiporter NhaA [unclassified Micromonospora]|uniref:Na+/H+ antiporter NhaA n=1 Tax=unclassified Micromonospora TaxID=2617518 RepID=UPI0022CA04D7|nr:Na+/H+ antiporter NhaA [Micromonospora sp. AKA38]GHJ16921.1 Na(+)/H(+) antiporter NhaA [Micromonospora sp. AKA38]
MPHHTPPSRLLARRSWPEARFLADVLRTETVGGGLLLLGAVLALVWANSPWRAAYAALGDWVPWPGGAALHLDLGLATWAADGLLAIFFFVVGLELKREFVAGDLRDPRRAALPVVAAVGGMAAPALIYLAVTASAGGAGLRGWAIPTATDIAFALAVLAVIGSHLPQGLRAFLLTLAVVDDLLAITIIAVFYTADFHPLPLLGALLPIAVFGLLVQRRRTWWWALIPLAVTAWVLVHASGVHATVAGVLLGFTVPVLTGRGGEPGLAERLEHRWRPISAGLAVPVFAFFAAGVSLVDVDLGAVVRDPVVLGVAGGLVLGKVIGVFGSTFLLARFTRAELDEEITWADLVGLALLAGIGFTVSLLIGELAFGPGSPEDERVKAAVLAGSLISAGLAAGVLLRRNRVHRRISERESRDDDGDGIPDVYQERPA